MHTFLSALLNSHSDDRRNTEVFYSKPRKPVSPKHLGIFGRYINNTKLMVKPNRAVETTGDTEKEWTTIECRY